MKVAEVHAGRDRDDLVWVHACGCHDGLDGGPAGDNPIGQGIDEGSAAVHPDGHVSTSHDWQAQGLPGQRREPAVDRAVRVDHADVTIFHEPAKRHEGPQLESMPHWDGNGRQTGGLRFCQEPARRLSGDQRRPAVITQPAHLSDDSNLLTTESA